MEVTIGDLLFGRPVATDEERAHRIGVLEGIPVLGLDALSSAAYGPEAALTVLLVAGAAGVRVIAPLVAVVVALMMIVFISYRQTIAAYPTGGGAYTVVKQNLGEPLGLLAAAALAVDYVLNVAVGLSAGVGAVVSALPSLQPHTLALCLGLLVLLTLVNLRGVRESGVAFLAPTFAFVVCLGLAIAVGAVRTVMAHGHPTPLYAPPRLPAATASLSAWLLVRAFASGCTAMTGIEAVSNAVPIFRSPTRRTAQRTLAAIISTLAILLLGIAVLCVIYRIGATPPGSAGYQTILSQLVGAVAGRGLFYHVSMVAVFAVLALSANTSFADFPRLCRVLAEDGFLPPPFAHRGRRLVYSAGIVALSLLAGVLLIAFDGVTDRLIPLFAIGAFLAFTLSQLGMVQHWRRTPAEHARRSMVVNAVGATATGLTLVVVLVSKLAQGAWVTVLLVGGLVILFRRVHAYYRAVAEQTEEPRPIDAREVLAAQPPIVIVPLAGWNRVAEKALRFALKLSADVRAVQVIGGPDIECENLESRWPALVEEPLRAFGLTAPRLDLVRSKYRRLYRPLLGYVERVRDRHPDREIAVVVPEQVEQRWYHKLLHTHRASVLKALLLLKGGPRVIIINTPWYLHD